MSNPSNPRPGADSQYPADEAPRLRVRESAIEQELIEKLGELKYTLRPDIRDRAALERNFREKFEALNRVSLSDAEFVRLLEEIVTADVFIASHTLRNRNAFARDDGTPLNYTLVNLNDWCKNTFEVASQLRINTDYSHHRYDVLLLINGVPVVQIELKTLGINPRRVPKLGEQQRIADYLSSLDTQIAAESTQLAALKDHKQGLMQQLFPRPEDARA